MKSSSEFAGVDKSSWANVRTISEAVGYSDRTGRRSQDSSTRTRIKVPTPSQIREALTAKRIDASHLVAGTNDDLTELGRSVLRYLEHRANVLSEQAEPNLMDAERAAALYDQLKAQIKPDYSAVLNKQAAEKKKPAYFTGIVELLVMQALQGRDCDFAPRRLTAITRQRRPLRTLSRWADGAFPSTVDPIAVWEIKEYYYATTFGSRVADAVYETLLDGMELEELRQSEGIKVKHYLMIDGYRTWWTQGRSYLCRIVDALHMDYMDEVLFGAEVVTRLPALVREWVSVSTG